MALYIPIHLWRRTSRVYQDLCTFLYWSSLPSFRLPINQGVSLAPCQGLALWKIFLPTTGSFFVNITFTDWLPVTALFPADVPLPRSAFPSASQQFFQSFRSIPGVAEVNRQFSLYLAAHFNHVSLPSDSYSLSSYAACTPLSGRPDISQHLFSIVIYAFCQYGIEDSKDFTCYRYHRLHLLQGIFLSCLIIPVDFPESIIFPYHGYRCFIQHISQSLPSPVTDMAFTRMLPGAVLYDRISCQFLQLLWIIKPAQVADLRDKSAYRFQPDPFDLKKFICIGDFLGLFFYLSHQAIHAAAVLLVVFQQVPDLQACRFRCFLATNAVLRCR